MRFGYLRWLRHLRDGDAPAFAAIGRAVRPEKPLSGQAVSGWMKRDVATDSRHNNRALAAYFSVSEDWLVDEAGEAPEPELWAVWMDARQAQRGREALAKQIGPAVVVKPLAPKQGAKRAVGGRRR